MKYEINFDKAMAEDITMKIWRAFESTEECFQRQDLPRNIRNAAGFSALVAELELFGADVDAHGIYDDNGYDRIGYARINNHEFVKNGDFKFPELQTALNELVSGAEV